MKLGFNTNADMREVYKRLAMTDNIEVSVTPSGSTKIYCSKCQALTYSGQLACCPWAVQMVDKYFNGGSSVSVSSLSESV